MYLGMALDHLLGIVPLEKLLKMTMVMLGVLESLPSLDVYACNVCRHVNI